MKAAVFCTRQVRSEYKCLLPVASLCYCGSQEVVRTESKREFLISSLGNLTKYFFKHILLLKSSGFRG